MKAIPVELKSIDLCSLNSSLPGKIDFLTISGDNNWVIHFQSPSNMWPEMVRAIPQTTMVIPTTTQLCNLSGAMKVIQFCISAGWTMRMTWRLHTMGVLSITFLRLSVTKSPEILEIIEIKQLEKFLMGPILPNVTFSIDQHSNHAIPISSFRILAPPVPVFGQDIGVGEVHGLWECADDVNAGADSIGKVLALV